MEKNIDDYICRRLHPAYKKYMNDGCFSCNELELHSFKISILTFLYDHLNKLNFLLYFEFEIILFRKNSGLRAQRFQGKY